MPRILLVEDDANIRALMEHVLLGDGYQVDPAPTAAQARMLLAGGGYDLVGCCRTAPGYTLPRKPSGKAFGR